MIQRRSTRGGRPRARWTTLDWAASLTISAFWHLLVLMVLVLAVHPFKLPDVNRAIDMELLPPLTTPPMPTVDVQLRPRQEDAPKPPEAAPPRPKLERALPQTPLLPKAEEIKPQPKPRQLLDMARPIERELEPPVEVARPTTRTQRLQTRQTAPNIPVAAPEPVTVTRAEPVLRQAVEIPRVQAPSRRPLDASRAAPQLPQVAAPSAPAADAPIATAPSEAAPTAPSPVQVLTNEAVVQSPVEIRPRERAPASTRLNTQTGAPEIPALPGGGEPAGGGPAAAGGQAGAGQAGRPGVGTQGGLKPFSNGDFGAGGLKGGLRTTLGCENPDAYKLSSEEREVCLQRFAQRARGSMDLGLPISSAKQAQFDHFEACRRATGGIALSGAASEGTSIRGLGANPTLKDCGPSTR